MVFFEEFGVSLWNIWINLELCFFYGMIWSKTTFQCLGEKRRNLV